MIQPSEFGFWAIVTAPHHELKGEKLFVVGEADDVNGYLHPCLFQGEDGKVDMLREHTLIASEDLEEIG